jgi:metallo-beta-lactamase family protein
MLADSANIQELEVAHLNRRNARRGRTEVEPIYTTADSAACQALFRTVAYNSWIEVSDAIRARYWNAGHMLGSASIEVEITDGNPPLRILFSRDIGPSFKLLHRDAEAPANLDYLVCESTYGATDRRDASPAVRQLLLRNEIANAVMAGGAIVIPSFAVERTQELLADIVHLMENREAPAIPIFIDSPLATKATEVFRQHIAEIDNGDMLARALASEHVKFTQSVEESKALDRIDGPHIVIAASGMCEAGRIRHRLRNWLWRPEATILFVGYQAEATLGRILLDGAKAVRIQGDEITVHAKIRSLDLYSGHADGPELSSWVEKRLPIRHGVFLVHGEPVNSNALRHRLATILPEEKAIIPTIDDSYELTSSGPVYHEPAEARRIAPDRVARRDWHNELSELILDIRDELDKAADEKARNVVIRRLRRALEGEPQDS